MKKPVDVKNTEKDWRADPKNQQLVKEATEKGYLVNKEKDPTGDINAVDKMLWDKNESKRKKEFNALMKTKTGEPYKEKGLAETMVKKDN
jgi:hypothetical protein